MSITDLKLCLSLIEETSKLHYEASSRGWKPRKKLSEMKEPEMRYIVVKDATNDIRGFTSLMPTYEEGEPVIYCYEIHLKPEMRWYVRDCRRMLGGPDSSNRVYPSINDFLVANVPVALGLGNI